MALLAATGHTLLVLYILDRKLFPANQSEYPLGLNPASAVDHDCWPNQQEVLNN